MYGMLSDTNPQGPHINLTVELVGAFWLVYSLLGSNSSYSSHRPATICIKQVLHLLNHIHSLYLWFKVFVVAFFSISFSAMFLSDGMVINQFAGGFH